MGMAIARFKMRRNQTGANAQIIFLVLTAWTKICRDLDWRLRWRGRSRSPTFEGFWNQPWPSTVATRWSNRRRMREEFLPAVDRPISEGRRRRMNLYIDGELNCIYIQFKHMSERIILVFVPNH